VRVAEVHRRHHQPRQPPQMRQRLQMIASHTTRHSKRVIPTRHCKSVTRRVTANAPQ
jgi:hypothetical protein